MQECRGQSRWPGLRSVFCPSQRWFPPSWRLGTSHYDNPAHINNQALGTYFYTGASTTITGGFGWPAGSTPKTRPRINELAKSVAIFDCGYAAWATVTNRRDNHPRGFYNIGFYDGVVLGVNDANWKKTISVTYWTPALDRLVREFPLSALPAFGKGVHFKQKLDSHGTLGAGGVGLAGMHAAHALCAVVDWLWP